MNRSCSTPVLAEAQQLAKRLVRNFTEPRKRMLNRRAPKSAYVHDLRRKMDAGLVRPVEMLIAVSVADQDEGIPTEVVIQPYLEIVALLRARRSGSGQDIRALSLPVLPLVQRTERADSELTLAENALLACPDSLAAMEHVLTAAARAQAEEQRLEDEVRARRARGMIDDVAVGAAR